MSPNPEQKECGEISPSAHFRCAERCAEGVHVTTKRRNTCGSAGFGFNYQPTEEIEKKAIGYLMGKFKVLPGVLAVAIVIHRNTAGKVCIFLWTAGKLLRDGRSYTWNPIGKEDASRLYRRFVADMLAYAEKKITNWGQHNKKLSNAYANGASDSWVTGMQWTDNLKKIRIGLRNCIEVQNNALLIILAQELSRECPTFMGDLYHRTKEEEADLVAERRMAYAARKPRIGKDDAFHAARQAKVAARQAAAKAARLEAERLLRAKAEGLLLQMDADQSKLGIAMQLIDLVGPEKSQRFLPRGEVA
jgi:hypothetical protein